MKSILLISALLIAPITANAGGLFDRWLGGGDWQGSVNYMCQHGDNGRGGQKIYVQGRGWVRCARDQGGRHYIPNPREQEPVDEYIPRRYRRY